VKRPQYFIAILSLTLLLSGCEVAEETLEISEESVTIAYAEPITDYSPFSYSSKDRKYLANIYESLVRYDNSFNTDTALAVAWGRINDTTWEFRLREGVVFHDGSSFDAEDVVYSLDLARSNLGSGSELESLLSGIESVVATEDYRIQISTLEPDPLLLSRLVNVYMVPKDYDEFIVPNGTGAYLLSDFEDQTLILDRFAYYWGDLPYFAEARLMYEPSLLARFEGILSSEIDVLANVPPQNVMELIESGLKVVDYPSLESSFLILNDTGAFSDQSLRDAAWSALDVTYADKLGGGYLVHTTQYAASGIMGYVSGWLPTGRELIVLDERVELTLDIPEGLSALGDMIAEDLYLAGIDVEVNALSLPDFEEKIYSGASDFYFFGWKYDLADVSEFFEAVVHSDGDFNGTNYSNESLDDMIELAAQTLELSTRRELLESIARTYFEEHVAYPLFESQVLYGVSPSVIWDVRLDGLILASEIRQNVVE
jgi:peptide/nickel transport system substrate-binding protein